MQIFELPLCSDVRSVIKQASDNTVFFDIETTGSRRDSDHIYMIGVIAVHDTVCRQYFAASEAEEKELLEAFARDLPRDSRLVSYYGEAFDLPFVEARCRNYGIASPFQSAVSVDLYKAIKPYKAALELPDARQTTLEKALGLPERQAPNGRKMISVYKAWQSIQNENPALASIYLNDLSLHNQEDLQGMAALLPLADLPDLASQILALTKTEFRESGQEQELILTLSLSSEFPLCLHFEDEDFALKIQENAVSFSTRVQNHYIKMKYQNCKDYYYLPSEDRVIPKSIGSSIARELRQNASPETCYTWIPIDSAFLSDQKKLLRYAVHNISVILKSMK